CPCGKFCNRMTMAYVPKTEAEQPLPPSDRAGLKLAAAKEERELVLRAQRGEASAYEQLVRIHQQRVLAVVGGILRRREDAEDVAQQALAKAYFSLRKFDLRSAFGT